MFRIRVKICFMSSGKKVFGRKMSQDGSGVQFQYGEFTLFIPFYFDAAYCMILEVFTIYQFWGPILVQCFMICTEKKLKAFERNSWNINQKVITSKSYRMIKDWLNLIFSAYTSWTYEVENFIFETSCQVSNVYGHFKS